MSLAHAKPRSSSQRGTRGVPAPQPVRPSGQRSSNALGQAKSRSSNGNVGAAFDTNTSQRDVRIPDVLHSTLSLPRNGHYTWHINPSTRPEVMEHRVRILAEDPAHQQVDARKGVVWLPGHHVDVPFSMPETEVAVLKVNLDWPTPDDFDLYVYYVNPDGSLIEVGNSGNFILEKEEALVELPDAGNYVLRVVNYASMAGEVRLPGGTTTAFE